MSAMRTNYIAIFLISLAGLVLEIAYTRLISFKLFYYYTYLIIGFALLGIGSGGIVVTISERLRRAPLQSVLSCGCLIGALTTLASYLVIVYVPINSGGIWTGHSRFLNIAALTMLCGALFTTFFPIGVMISTLFGRHAESIEKLYFADLIGAGLGCAIVVPLIGAFGPPATVIFGSLILALTAALLFGPRARVGFTASLLLAALLLGGVLRPSILPSPVTDASKTIRPNSEIMFSRWSPVFRIDVTEAYDNPDVRIIHHDGLMGSTLHRFDGDVSKLSRFDKDERSIPFRTLGRPPERALIIGAAGGHEVLAALYFGTGQINAVELNPVTVSLLTDHFADWTGHLPDHPRVNLVNGEGRSYLATDEGLYDLIFFVAPDSYAAMNAATAGAFVLSESYLYTNEMIVESLEHLEDDGILCMHFGEFDYNNKPNRTARYVGTARRALAQLGIEKPELHILVATTDIFIPLSTILVKRTPFTTEEIDRFVLSGFSVPNTKVRYAWGHERPEGPIRAVLETPVDQLDDFYDSHPYDVTPITDDAPFFWHFARFGRVIASFWTSLEGPDPEDTIGERLLLLLLAIAATFAAVLLLLPFVVIRDTWRALPHKLHTAAYFACLGLGFMFFEISLIQKLTLFLGYPTYSLTVTLMSILVFTGIGSLMTGAYADRRRQASLVILGALALLTVFYQFGLGPLTEAFLSAPLPIRVVIAFISLAPLGLCLGAFMPLGLGAVAGLSEHDNEYVAWAWAVNGFFSVIGSVLTTMLSMTFGFQKVLLLGLVVYAAAVTLLRTLPERTRG